MRTTIILHLNHNYKQNMTQKNYVPKKVMKPRDGVKQKKDNFVAS